MKMSVNPAAAKTSASRSVETITGPAGVSICSRATSTDFAVFKCAR